MQKHFVTHIQHHQDTASLVQTWQYIKWQANGEKMPPHVRFSALQHPRYSGNEVVELYVDTEFSQPMQRINLVTSVSSLLGEHASVTREIYKQAFHAKFDLADESVFDFIGVLNNRYYRLFCQSEIKYNLVAQLEEEKFSWNHYKTGVTEILANLLGLSAAHRDLPFTHLIKYSAILGLKTTNLAALKSILEDYFQIQFELNAHELEYMPLFESSLTRIGAQGDNRTLGINAVIGKSTPMIGHRIKIYICPNDYEHYLSIRHDKHLLNALNYFLRLYLDLQIKILIYFKINSAYLPSVKLSSANKKGVIGQTAWMANSNGSDAFLEIPLL